MPVNLDPGSIERPTLVNQTKLRNTINPSIKNHYGSLMYGVDDGIATNYITNFPAPPSNGHNSPKEDLQEASLHMRNGFIVGRKYDENSPAEINVRYLFYIDESSKDLCVDQLDKYGDKQGNPFVIRKYIR